MHHLVKTLSLALVSALAVLTSACSTLAERTISVSQQQLQDKLSAKLAAPITVLKLFEVNLSNPLVKLDAGTERITTHMDATIGNALLGKSLKGRAGVSGKLQFDPASQSILLIDPKVETLNIDGLPARFNDLITALSATLGGELLKDLPLYTIKPEDLKVAGIQFVPKLLKIRPEGLAVTLAPK